MTPDQDSHSDRLDAGYGRGTASGTVQLLVADSGNRTAIREMLSDRFDVETSRSVGDADLYLIEDRLLSAYREELRDRVERAHPEFRPVVVIRRETADLTFGFTNESERERSILVDDVVDAPIDRPLLVQRLHSLLVRRQQSRELSRHVATLSARERDLRRFERGVEAAGNGIAITDRTGTIEYVNPAFERITAFSEGAIIGQTPRVLQPDGATAVFDEAFWRTMTDRGEWEGEVVIERTDETRCVADITVTAFGAEGDVTEGFVLVMNDITERIQREQQLQSREKELDLLRQILTRYLRHNLRNDLNVILGYARLLADADSLPEGHRRGTEQIVAATKRLMERSDTARTYSTLLERDAELSAYDLSDIVTDAVRAVREQYPAVDVEFDVPDTCRIQGRTGIRDAVEDLIENAVRHNDASSPWLRIRIRERDGVRLTIDDNGPGIPDFEIAALERGDETPLSHSQGIGLWLCKWVIEGVEGELSFEPTDAGTRVIVEFPPSDRVSEGGLDVPDLKERERRLQTVLDRMTDAIVEVDASWDVAFLDRRAEEILGVDAEEILGRNFWEVFSDARGTQFEAVFRDVMESRSSASIEEYYSGIGGWLEIHVYPEFGGGLSLYARDVTERNERKRELEQAQERIEFALKATETTIWEWDFQDDSITTHPDTHIGFDSVVTTIDDFMEGVHPDDQRRLREELRAAIDAESSYQTEFRVPTDDGFQWIEDYGELRRDDCVPTRMIGIARDVTERKERERALQERVKELTAIYDAARVFETTDAPLEEVLETFIETVRESFQHPDVAEVRLAYDEIDVSTAGFEPGGEMLSTRAEIANGGALRLDVAYRTEPSDRHGDPFLPEEKRLLDTLTTILKGHLKRRGYLKEIERTRDLLTNAERLGGVGAWEVDPSTEEAFWTEGTRRIFGVGEEFDPTFEATLEFVHPDDRETVSEAFDACVETGESFDLESRIHTADGKERWVHIEGESIGHAEERQAVRGHLQDITERKDRNRRYEAIFNQTYQFTGLMEPDGTLIEANRAALEFGGVTREQVLGQKIWNTYWFGISEETQQQTRADVKRAAAGEFVRRELEVRGEDGTVIIDFSIRPVTDEHEDVVLLVPEGRNITERKERERELERAKQRLDVALREARAGIWGWDLDTDERY